MIEHHSDPDLIKYFKAKRNNLLNSNNLFELCLGVVLPPDASLCMWFGAAFFWWQSRKYKTRGTKGHEKWVEGCESICAGLISGAALMGIGNAILGVLPWMR